MHIAALLPLLLLLLQQESPKWWNDDWQYRRAIELINSRQRAVERGTRVKVRVLMRFLKINDKAKKDLTDFRMVYRGKEIPYELGNVDEQEGTAVIWFRLQKEIRRGTHNRDTGYALYFGNEKAKAPSYDASALYHLSVDMSSRKQVKERLEIDPLVRGKVAERGGWNIHSVDKKCSEAAPARIVFKCPPPGRNQTVRVSISWDPPEDGAAGFLGLMAGGTEAPKVDEKTRKKIGSLVRDLSNDEWEVRERATTKLVGFGRSALPQLREAARSEDLEVRSRARTAISKIEGQHPTRQSLVGIRWKDGKATGVGSWNLGSTPITASPMSFGTQHAVNLVLWREEATRGVEIEMADGNYDFIREIRDRLTSTDPPEEFKLVLWGDGTNPFPNVRIHRITVSPEVKRQAHIGSSIEPQETRP